MAAIDKLPPELHSYSDPPNLSQCEKRMERILEEVRNIERHTADPNRPSLFDSMTEYTRWRFKALQAKERLLQHYRKLKEWRIRRNMAHGAGRWATTAELVRRLVAVIEHSTEEPVESVLKDAKDYLDHFERVRSGQESAFAEA